ncbi:uncharacterized protein JN550_002819 [Neoarthrinium moseri]|uniref:uncharacterized protein n=1 Tax=Neoarthrinium moseri TaxID=1658444 RepID=UPI001FDD2807|nr:uncharacterized protein JN550_002819 [Neoarthrinium moseri]KAI1874240.1 hypothetical protein JN550_002819 [Neoarthrinium moseri]
MVCLHRSLWFLAAHLPNLIGVVEGSDDNVEKVDLNSLQSFGYRPRVFMLSDILNEPDDSMSLVRYLLYANEFDTRGICATTSWWLRNETHPEEMRRIITAYGEVVDNLNNHVNPNASYQSADYLLSLVTSGPSTYGRAALNETLSEGAGRIIEALEESDEPLFITGWGGTNTLAQALLHMDNNMPAPKAAALRSKIRLYTISDQDNTGPWIRTRYPDVFYVVSIHAFNNYKAATWTGIGLRGCPCVDSDIVWNPWLDANIRLGPFGALYPQVVYTMEGDTPSFLWLVQNGLVYRDRIDWGTWGGRYSHPVAPSDWTAGIDSNHFVNTIETVIGADGVTYSTHQASIWRWRAAYQEDFATRMQWTLTPNFTAAGHPPILNVNKHQGPEPLFIKINANESFTLDASLTYDPDHPTDNSKLEFQWALYPEPTSFLNDYLNVQIEAVSPSSGAPLVLQVNDAGFSNVTLGRSVKVIPPISIRNPNTGLSTTDFHILLQVTNRAGPYPIRRYMRIVLTYHGHVPATLFT